MIEKKYRTRILISEIPENETLTQEHLISSAESQTINQIFENVLPIHNKRNKFQDIYQLD